MFGRLTLSLTLFFFAIVFCKNSSANLITDNGGNTPYTLNSGDTLLIANGIYTGAISTLPNGATILIDGPATFSPTGFSTTMGNSAKGRIEVYGILSINYAIITNTNFTLYNYGIVDLAGVTTRGNNQYWFNSWGGTINFNGDVLMNGTTGDFNNKLINHESVNSFGNFQMNSGSQFENYRYFTTTGNFKVNGGTLINEGKFEVTGLVDMNNGASIIKNYCKLISSGGIAISSGNLYNYSYVWAKNDLGTGFIIVSNSGTIYNQTSHNSIPVIHAKDLTFSGGLITGLAHMYFYGNTNNTGGTTGAAGFQTDSIRVYDVTRVNPVPTQIYDLQNGTVLPNAVYRVWGVPDSTRDYINGCSFEIYQLVPLALNWNDFDVTIADKYPLLKWTSTYSSGTIFDLQRSYDGINFVSLGQQTKEEGRSVYTYEDISANTKAQIIYYRIRSIETTGNETFSQVRYVKYSNRTNSKLLLAPNPFSTSFNLDYNSSENGSVMIRMFNVSGQQAFVKKVSVNTGFNRINIDASNLPKGIYFIQVNDQRNKVLSGKTIKL